VMPPLTGYTETDAAKLRERHRDIA